jgi:hypothetical protein
VVYLPSNLKVSKASTEMVCYRETLKSESLRYYMKQMSGALNTNESSGLGVWVDEQVAPESNL